MAVIYKKTGVFTLVFAAIVAAGLLLYFYYPMASQKTEQPLTQVLIGTTTIAVEVEATEAARERGLSGRASLAEGSGMLFIFEQEGRYGFWMKDMSFALDMIYADQSGRIVTIVRNATPESYLQNPPQVFYPTSPAKYVLEVPAGFAAAHHIEEGMELKVRP